MQEVVRTVLCVVPSLNGFACEQHKAESLGASISPSCNKIIAQKFDCVTFTISANSRCHRRLTMGVLGFIWHFNDC